MRQYEKMLCVCFLKLDALLCFNHCRSAPLYTFSASLQASSLPSHPSSSGAKTSSSGYGPGSRSALGLWPGLSFWRSTGSGACSDSWLRSCFAPARARALAQAQTFSSSSRFRPPSSVPSLGQIACPSQPMAIAARPCPPMAIAARSH